MIEPWRWPLIGISAAVGGVAGGLVFGYASWFLLFIAWFAGQLIAGMLLPVSGRRPGTALAVVAVVFLILGVFMSGGVDGAMDFARDAAHDGPLTSVVTAGVLAKLLSPWDWVGAVIMAVSAFGRLR
jgi:hypothetical protein